MTDEELLAFMRPNDWIDVSSLRALEAVVKAEALDDAANDFEHGQLTFLGTSRQYTKAWLRARADEIRKEES